MTVRVVTHRHSHDGAILAEASYDEATYFETNSRGELMVKKATGQDVAMYAPGNWIFASVEAAAK